MDQPQKTQGDTKRLFVIFLCLFVFFVAICPNLSNNDPSSPSAYYGRMKYPQSQACWSHARCLSMNINAANAASSSSSCCAARKSRSVRRARASGSINSSAPRPRPRWPTAPAGSVTSRVATGRATRAAVARDALARWGISGRLFITRRVGRCKPWFWWGVGRWFTLVPCVISK